MSGFIALPREILDVDSPDAWFPNDLPVASLYAYLVNKARWCASNAPLPRQKHPLLAGQLVIGQAELALKFEMSRKRIRTLLSRLSKYGKVAIKGANEGSIITICNYEQLFLHETKQGPAEGPTRGQPGANQGPHRDKETRGQDDKSPLNPPGQGRDFTFDEARQLWNEHKAPMQLEQGPIGPMLQRQLQCVLPCFDRAAWIEVCKAAAALPYCRGETEVGFVATFGWLSRDDNAAKIRDQWLARQRLAIVKPLVKKSTLPSLD